MDYTDAGIVIDNVLYKLLGMSKHAENIDQAKEWMLKEAEEHGKDVEENILDVLDQLVHMIKKLTGEE